MRREWVKLTPVKGAASIVVNLNHVITMLQNVNSTVLTTDQGKTIEVKESPKSILAQSGIVD